MKSLFVTSIEAYSGKTALCLALGKLLQGDGYRVGYLKPVSTQPWRTPEGMLVDEDAAFVKKLLELDLEIALLSPVVITSSALRQHLLGASQEDYLVRILEAAKAVGAGREALLLEGGASLRDGYALGLSNLTLAEALGAPALVMIKYRSEMAAIDDALTARFRLGDQLFGVLFNHVPEEALPFLQEYVAPYLQREGINLVGTLPRVPRLSALSVGELAELLEAQVLTESMDAERLIETFTVGAMTADVALSRFRRYLNKAVITGGDRTDIQLAALETSTAALILTGNLHPSPLIIQQAEALGVTALLVKDNTMETVEAIERAYGKTRLGQPEKLETFKQLMIENVDLDRIYGVLGLKRK